MSIRLDHPFGLMKSYQCILLCLLLVNLACDRPDCSNKNPVFDQYEPHNQEYKEELVHELHRVDQNELTYWLKKYEARDGVEYLLFNVQSDELCAIIEIRMNDWEGIELVRKKKAVSYRGAEFVGLKYDVRQSKDETEFLYRGVVRIID